MTDPQEKLPQWMISVIIAISFTLTTSCGNSASLESSFISHPNDPSKQVEYYLKKPLDEGPFPAIILLHGHQAGSKPGGKDFVKWGTLDDYSNKGFVAVAISQPGYGDSDGPPDYCGTFTQQAVVAVIDKLVAEGTINADEIILQGISRGAVVAGLVAANRKPIKGLILISGVYDFIEYQEHATTNSNKKLIMKAIKAEAGNSQDSLYSRSVLNFAENIAAATLILNGEDDEKTIPHQAEELASKINKNGGMAEVIIFKNTAHYIPVDKRNKLIDAFISNVLDKDEHK